MATAQDRLNQILPSWYDLLTQWSLDGSLVAAATDALMLESSNAKQDAKGQLQSYVSQWSAGNFNSLPQIVLLTAEDISGAYGAYADSTDTIYLNQEWLLGANSEDIQKVLTEELGHFLDDQLNNLDTQGDEGDSFSLRLANASSTVQGPSPLDAGTIVVEGRFLQAEFALSPQKAWSSQLTYGNLRYIATDPLLGGALIGGFGITSGATADIWLSYVSTTGNARIIDTIDSGYNDYLESLSFDTYGNIYIAGGSDGRFGGEQVSSDPLGDFSFDSYVSKYNAAGTMLWTRFYGISTDDTIFGLSVLTNGNILASRASSQGARLLEINAADGTIVQEKASPRTYSRMAQDITGSLYCIFSYGSTVDRYNTQTLELEWSKTLNNMQSYLLTDIDVDLSGAAYVSGRDTSNPDSDQQRGFIAKLDNNGSVVWQRTIGNQYFGLTDIDVGDDGSIYITGADNRSNDAYVYNGIYDSSGSPVWEEITPFNDFLGGVQIAKGKSNDFYTGSYGSVNRYTVPQVNIGQGAFRINGSGIGQDAQTLTCIEDPLNKDPDGMSENPPSTYTYQWETSTDGTKWTNATGTGATTFKYSVNTTLDAGKFLRVQVRYTDDKGFKETVFTGPVKILSGTTKNDSFKGTSDIEVTFSGSGADAVATGAGNDFAKGGIGNDTFTGQDGDGDDFFDGQTEIDIVNYSASSKGVDIDFVTGLATERTTGGIGKDSFAGIENARGTTGADSFKGSTGVNVFTGSGGADTFNFANAQAFGASTSDRITDMSSDDKIQVSASAFNIVGKPYSFAAVSGTKAVNASAALIVYDTGSGYLYLNKDGGTSGMGGGGIFAVLDNKFVGLAAGNVSLI